jgi:hypothetical protein
MKIMKDSLLIAAVVLSGSVLAQENDRVYDGQGYQNSPPSSSKVIILNNNSSDVNSNQNQRSRVVSQPTTSVEAAPLTDSRADELRKARQGAEINTEQKIVEKLEESRLKDEKKRADKLFGNRLDSDDDDAKPAPREKEQPAAYVAPQPQPQQPQQPQVIVVQTPVVQEKEIVEQQPPQQIQPVLADGPGRGEIRDRDDHDHDGDAWHDGKWYVGGLVGGLSYNTPNARGNVATGVSIGKEYGNGLVLDGSFLYSNVYLTDYWAAPGFFTNVNEYSGVFTVKYNLMRDWIRPYIGGDMAYVYRSYTDRSYYGGGYPGDASVSSQSIDLGIVGGVDVMVNDTFSIGGDLRYNFNIVSLSDNYFIGRDDLYADGSKPLEKTGYWQFLITGKLRF